jgi:hypothetical protein
MCATIQRQRTTEENSRPEISGGPSSRTAAPLCVCAPKFLDMGNLRASPYWWRDGDRPSRCTHAQRSSQPPTRRGDPLTRKALASRPRGESPAKRRSSAECRARRCLSPHARVMRDLDGGTCGDPSVVASNSLAVAVRDGFPVTRQHTLVLPRRHVAGWFDLYRPERAALERLLDDQRSALQAPILRLRGSTWASTPGEAAGQRIFHWPFT